MENLNKLKSTLHGKSYPEKYEIWSKILDTVEGHDFHVKCELYTEFLQEFPFVYTQWNTLAQMYAKEREPNKAFQIYEWGLGLNKRCLKLWQCFCAWVEDTFRDNKDLVRETYNKAIIAVGLDYNSSSVWDRYLRFEEAQNNYENQNTLYWRYISVPQKTISTLPLRFKNFIEQIDDLETIKAFAEKLNLPVHVDQEGDNQAILEAYRKSLSLYYDSYALQTSHLVVNKAVFEEKLRQNVYEGKTHEPAERNTWLNYINYEKNVPLNQHANILFIIEKATTYLCTCPEVWRELVDYLEISVGDRQYLLSSLRNYRKMLRNIDINLVFLEADLSELSGDVDEARTIYTELDAFRPKNAEISIRRCQFEIRQSRVNDAINIYDGLLFKSNLKLNSKIFVLTEYLALLRRKSTKEACLKLLDNALKELPFSRLVYNIYCDYIIEHEPYTDCVRKLVKAFENALPKAKKVSEVEFNLTLHMYQMTIRAVCRNINLIFKIEKNLNMRFKEPRKDGEEYESKARELALELEVEILRATTEEDGVNSPLKGEESGDFLGKRSADPHLNGNGHYSEGSLDSGDKKFKLD